MRVVITLRDQVARADTTVLVEAAPDTPMTRILAALSPRSTPVDDGQTSPPGETTTFGRSGLVDGAVLTLGRERPPVGPPPGAIEIRFVGGEEAGRVEHLAVGSTPMGLVDGRLQFGAAVGPGAECAVVLAHVDGGVRIVAHDQTDDPDVDASRVALRLEDDRIAAEPLPWTAGHHVHVAGSVLSVEPVKVRDAVLVRAPDEGRLDFNRPPRLLPPRQSTHFKLPSPPVPPNRNALPWLTAMIPALLGVAMAVLLKQPFYLLFALMSPVMMLGSNLSSRRSGKKSYRRQVNEHAETLASIHREVEAAVAAEQARRRVESPDAAALRLAATTPTRRLWERRPTDPDHLRVRFGAADLPSSVELEDMAALEHRRLSTGITRHVPVTLDLGDAGVVGIAGAAEVPRDLGRWVVGQLAVLQSPRDLQVYVLTSPAASGSWDWSAWLPHLRPSLGQDALALFGSDSETLGRRVAELNQLIVDRRKAASQVSRPVRLGPDVLVVLDGALRLRAMPGVVTLLQDGPSVGIVVLCLDSHERQLPEECTAVVVATAADRVVVKRHNADDVDEVLTDVVDPTWFDAVARSLAPVRDVSVTESEALLPTAATLLDVLELADPTADEIVSRWGRGGRSTEAVIGVSLDGPFGIDVVRDGPHGLVAGTTGSGKSEFLQTLVASLAAANRPDSMTFVLIDYKGGAAFSGCIDLPHTVGLVTDLDPHLVERALDSLRAELVRRERLLGAASAKDIEDYYAVLARDGGEEALPDGKSRPEGQSRLEGLPRLMIVIDEFAALAKELPDFVAGLIGIAQRGRSLGVHLIMATQRPSGVISPEIRANTNLRVALRMTDAGESSDVIDISDAARISKNTPGRAYARLGHASVIPFQTARVGGTRRVATRRSELPEPFVATLTWKQLSMPVPRRPRERFESTEATDLSVLVEALRGAGEALGIPAQHSPWLPQLPVGLALSELSDAAGPDSFSWAREDLPSEQSQRDSVIDLDRFRHLYIVGAPGSGRSQALRTLASSAAATLGVDDLHLYGIDCGNGALTSLADLPHCGALAQRSQLERATRLIDRLHAEVLRRHELFGAGDHANITEQRRGAPTAERLPHLLVLIDRWENFVPTLGELDGGRLVDTIHALLRDGAGAGVHLVIAGDRTLLTSRMAVLTDDKLVLRLTDRLDYSLAGLNHKKLPLEIPAGRGFRSGTGTETQIALLDGGTSGRQQVEAVRELARELRAVLAEAVTPATKHPPFRVDDLPSELWLDEALLFARAGLDADPGADMSMWGLVGVGGDDLLAHGADLANDAPTFLVAGPARSGRSSMLHALALSLLRSGTELVIAAPRPSPLRALAGTTGVRHVFTGTDLPEDELEALLGPGTESSSGPPVVLLVDDGELLIDATSKQWLRSFVRTAGDHRRGIVLGGNSAEICTGFSGWQIDVKKNRRGALLSPQNTIDGDLVGVRLPRSAVSGRLTPGRALVHLGDGQLATLQVPRVPADQARLVDTSAAARNAAPATISMVQ